MRSRLQGFLFGVVFSIFVLGMVITASATVGKQMVELDYNNIKVTLDGAAVNLVDANGAAVEPFAINGTTYLPVRAVANALGLGVQWDGATTTVVLSSKSVAPIVETQSNHNGEKHLIAPGQVFDAGGYLLLDGVELFYNGEKFLITNNRNDYVLADWKVVGVKKDGTYDEILSGMFCGTDWEMYQKDLEENGWALEHVKTLISPGETMESTESMPSAFKISESFGVNADIDGDGYYDIVFSILPQKDKDKLLFSSDNPASKSGVYKMIAN